jgi:N-acetylmuramoyl-L-alanine amidase
MGVSNMKIIEKFMTVNPFIRPRRKLAECMGVILHYVGIPNQRALTVWNYFAVDCPRNNHHSSTQYIVDLNGDVYQTMPDDEVAWHCGSSKVDPASGRIYTDWARKMFGRFANSPQTTSPNHCTIGIELCINDQGNFTPETLNAAVELVAKLLKENKLTTEEIGHHNLVVGWKDCPRPWVRNIAGFSEFKKQVKEKLDGKK